MKKIIILTFIFIVLLSLYYYSNYRRMIIDDNKPVGNYIVDYLDRPYKNFTFYSSDIGTNWNPMQYYLMNKNKTIKDYGDKWKNHIGEIENLMKWNKIEPDQKFKDSAVFHFRCSDSPFDKDTSYTLLPKEYYHFITDFLNDKNIDKLYVITNYVHFKNKNSIAMKKCPNFVDTILDWIEEKANFKIERTPLFLSVRESYQAFLGSKVLFNNTSSFSFIPGLLKGKNFITPTMLGGFANKGYKSIVDNYGEEFDNIHEKVHWTMWNKQDFVPHQCDYNTFIYKNITQ